MNFIQSTYILILLVIANYDSSANAAPISLIKPAAALVAAMKINPSSSFLQTPRVMPVMFTQRYPGIKSVAPITDRNQHISQVLIPNAAFSPDYNVDPMHRSTPEWKKSKFISDSLFNQLVASEQQDTEILESPNKDELIADKGFGSKVINSHPINVKATKKSKKNKSRYSQSTSTQPSKKAKFIHEIPDSVHFAEPSKEVLFGKGPPDIDLIKLSKEGVVFDATKGPSKVITPGVMCTPQDPDYKGIHYGIHKCKRSVSKTEKRLIGKLYGVPESDFSQYEFDHLIPLGLGGSNHPCNIWPQYRDGSQKHLSRLAGDAHRLLSSGKINQEQAVMMILDAHNKEYKLEQKYP